MRFLIGQLKQRLNSLKYISKFISLKFACQMANALLISKLNYQIDVWGHTSKENFKKIDKILIQAAKIVIGKESIGRSNQWLFTNLKWFDTKTRYENAMQNNIFRILNNQDEHDFKHYFTLNRSIRMMSENKLGPHHQSMGNSIHTQKSFLYRAIALYNNLPKNLTLSPNQSVFKKWCKLYNLDKNVKIPSREYNVNPRVMSLIDPEIIRKCEENEG